MGMYTGLRFKGVIKKEYVELIKVMMEDWLDWKELYEQFPQHEFLHDFSEVSRSSFIPYGVLSYMPEQWEESTEFHKDFDEETRTWTFQCSLKNYDKTIEIFFNLIVPELVEEAQHLEYYYEEWERSVFYELKNGEVVRSEKEGVCYEY